MLNYNDKPVVVIKWSDPPEHGSSDQSVARKLFDKAMDHLQQELEAGGYIVGFSASDDYPTRYAILVVRNAAPVNYMSGVYEDGRVVPTYSFNFD